MNRWSLAWLITSRRTHVVLLSAVAVALMTLIFNAAAAHAFTGNSDGATVVLEGSAISHGNLTLHEWFLSLDSFWTVDAPFYAIGVVLWGVRASLMHLVPAFLAALAVLSIVLTIGADLNKKARIIATGLVVVAVVIPNHALTVFFVQGPWHVGTALYCLLAFAAFARARYDWTFVIGVVLLAAGLLGDFQAFALGVVPLFLAGVVAALRTRSIRAALPAIAGSVSSLLLALVIRLLSLAVGTFRIERSHHTVTKVQFGTNVHNFFGWTAAMFGIRKGAFGGPTISRALEAPHVLPMLAVGVGVVCCLVAMLLGAVKGSSFGSPVDRAWHFDDMLVFGFLASAAVFEFLTLANNPAYARYLNAVMIFGVALGARWLGRILGDQSGFPIAAVGILGAIVLATSVAVFAFELSKPEPVAPTAALESFLSSHNLHQGIGDYWVSSIVTVDTQGRTKVRPVIANRQDRLVADGRQTTSRWFGDQKFSFLIYDKQPYGDVTLTTATKTFGTPAHVYQVGSFSVVVWSHAFALGNARFP